MVKMPIGTIPHEFKKGYYIGNDASFIQLQDVQDYYDRQYDYFYVFGTDGMNVMLYGVATWRNSWNGNRQPEFDGIIMKNISIAGSNTIGTIQFNVEHMYFRAWPIMA